MNRREFFSFLTSAPAAAATMASADQNDIIDAKIGKIATSPGSVPLHGNRPYTDPIAHHGVEYVANKNVPNGYVGLDGSGKVSETLLPMSIISPTVETVSSFQASVFDVRVQSVRILGWSALGHSPFNVRRVNSQPAHPWKFQSADGRWWEGYPEDGYVTPQMFGAVGDDVTDDYAAFANMTSYVVAQTVNPAAAPGSGYAVCSKINIRIPAAFYYLSRTWQITTTTRIYGMMLGETGGYKGHLRFPVGVAGILVYNGTLSGANIRDFFMENIFIRGAATVATPIAHGLEIRNRCILKNVGVGYFSGCGIYLNGRTQEGFIVDSSLIERCQASHNYQHGFLISNADGNCCTFHTCSATSNYGYAYMDFGSFGNTYISCHEAGNGVMPGYVYTGFVQYEGVIYAVTPQYSYPPTFDYPACLTTTPGTDETVWTPTTISPAGYNVVEWAPNTPPIGGKFTASGGYGCGGAPSVYINSYNETSGFVANNFGSGAIVIGGLLVPTNLDHLGIPTILSSNWKTGFIGTLETVRKPLPGAVMQTITQTFGNKNKDYLRTILASTDAPKGWWEWLVNGNIKFDDNNTNIWTISGPNTTAQFGSGMSQPGVFVAAKLGLGDLYGPVFTYGTAAPTTGYAGKGWIVWNTAATAGGFAGWICTTAGQNGVNSVWKPFGTIAV
jgi:hypothetical protein